MGSLRVIESKGMPNRSVQLTLNIGCVLRSSGPFRIRLTVLDLVTCLARYGFCSTCDHRALGYESNCCTLRAAGYDFFFALPFMTSSPA